MTASPSSHGPVVSLLWGQRLPTITDHLFRLEHNDAARGLLINLARRYGLLTYFCRNVFLMKRVPKLRIPLRPNHLSASVGGHIGMGDRIIDNHRDVGITDDIGMFGGIFCGGKDERFAIPYSPDWRELKIGRASCR